MERKEKGGLGEITKVHEKLSRGDGDARSTDHCDHFMDVYIMWRHIIYTYGCQVGGWGEGIVREFGMDTYTLLYLKWMTNKNLLYSTGNSAQCYVAAWMGGEFGGEWVHVYVWLNPFAVHLKPSHCLWISCTPTQNKVFKKKVCSVLYVNIVMNCFQKK